MGHNNNTYVILNKTEIVDSDGEVLIDFSKNVGSGRDFDIKIRGFKQNI